MASMSYCIFENGFNDLDSVYDRMNELYFGKRNLSESEQRYFEKLVRLCQTITEEFSEEAASKIRQSAA